METTTHQYGLRIRKQPIHCSNQLTRKASHNICYTDTDNELDLPLPAKKPKIKLRASASSPSQERIVARGKPTIQPTTSHPVHVKPTQKVETPMAAAITKNTTPDPLPNERTTDNASNDSDDNIP